MLTSIKQNKTTLFFVLLILEILTFYFLDKRTSLIFKLSTSGVLFWYYYSNCPLPRKKYDKILLLSIMMTMMGEIAFFLSEIKWMVPVVLFIYLVEHQLYIILIRNPRIDIYNFGNKDFLSNGWPYLLFAFLFFGFYLKDIVPDSIFFLVLLYVFQFGILGVFSFLVNQDNPGKIWFIWGVILNIISDVFSSVFFFQGPYLLDYFLIRTTFIVSKFLIINGFLKSRKRFKVKYS